MQISRLSVPLAAVVLAGCAHTTAGTAREADLPPAPSLSEAPVPAPVKAPRLARSATR